MRSPTERSLKYLRDGGYTVEVVERWDHFARKRRDLFGIFDLLCVRDGETLAVQTTSTGVSSRVKKITDSPFLGPVRKAGWSVHVHGWRKSDKTGKYVLRVVDLS